MCLETMLVYRAKDIDRRTNNFISTTVLAESIDINKFKNNLVMIITI